MAHNLLKRQFGYLSVIKSVGSNKHKRRLWLCRCQCGKEIIKPSNYLISGDTKSCGCFRKELMTKHGLSTSRFYSIWGHMIKRCSELNGKNYNNYGRRGIKVCSRWLKFENFRDDMFESYNDHISKFGEKQTTIDRINNDGNYKLLNCRWATYKEQNLNRSI